MYLSKIGSVRIEFKFVSFGSLLKDYWKYLKIKINKSKFQCQDGLVLSLFLTLLYEYIHLGFWIKMFSFYKVSIGHSNFIYSPTKTGFWGKEAWRPTPKWNARFSLHFELSYSYLRFEMGKVCPVVGKVEKKFCPVGCLSLAKLNWDSQQGRIFLFQT